MYYFFYEDSTFETAPYASYDEANSAWDDVAAQVAELFGYCEPDRLFLAEYEE